MSKSAPTLYIKEWRKAAGLTLRALGEKISDKVSGGTIHSYETGERTPSQSRLAEIAKAVGTEPARLFERPPPPGGTAEPVAARVSRILERMEPDMQQQAIRVLEALADGRSGA